MSAAVREALASLYVNDTQYGGAAGTRGALASLCTALSLLPTFRAATAAGAPAAASAEPLQAALRQLCASRAWHSPQRATLLGFVVAGCSGLEAKAAAALRTEALHVLTTLLLLSPECAAPHAHELKEAAEFLVRGDAGDAASTAVAALGLLDALLGARLLPSAAWERTPGLLQSCVLAPSRGAGSSARAAALLLLGRLPAHLPPAARVNEELLWSSVLQPLWGALREQLPLTPAAHPRHAKGVAAAALRGLLALFRAVPGLLDEAAAHRVSPLEERNVTPHHLLHTGIRRCLACAPEAGKGAEELEAALELLTFAASSRAPRSLRTLVAQDGKELVGLLLGGGGAPSPLHSSRDKVRYRAGDAFCALMGAVGDELGRRAGALAGAGAGAGAVHNAFAYYHETLVWERLLLHSRGVDSPELLLGIRALPAFGAAALLCAPPHTLRKDILHLFSALRDHLGTAEEGVERGGASAALSARTLAVHLAAGLQAAARLVALMPLASLDAELVNELQNVVMC